MLKELIREAPIGQLLRYLSNNRVLLYPEEMPDFVLPATYQAIIEGKESQLSSTFTTPAPTIINSKPGSVKDVDPEAAGGEKSEQVVVPEVAADGTILVDWYTKDDPANPLNWSNGKRATIAAMIVCYLHTRLTFSMTCELTMMSVFTHLLCMQAPQSTPLASWES